MPPDETLGTVAVEIRDLLKDLLIARGETEDASNWNHFHLNVPIAGEPKQLAPHTIPIGYELVIKANPENSGVVYFGRTKELVLDTSRRVPLNPNESTSLKISNTNLVWIDAVVADEGVIYWYESRR